MWRKTLLSFCPANSVVCLADFWKLLPSQILSERQWLALFDTPQLSPAWLNRVEKWHCCLILDRRTRVIEPRLGRSPPASMAHIKDLKQDSSLSLVQKADMELPFGASAIVGKKCTYSLFGIDAQFQPFKQTCTWFTSLSSKSCSRLVAAFQKPMALETRPAFSPLVLGCAWTSTGSRRLLLPVPCLALCFAAFTTYTVESTALRLRLKCAGSSVKDNTSCPATALYLVASSTTHTRCLGWQISSHPSYASSLSFNICRMRRAVDILEVHPQQIMNIAPHSPICSTRQILPDIN